jgi:hypothetical protein
MQTDELKVWIAFGMCIIGIVSAIYFFWDGWNQGEE